MGTGPGRLEAALNRPPERQAGGGDKEQSNMPRKPNYRFERMEREKSKAAKKAARQEAKQRKTEERKQDKSEQPEATE